MTEATRKEQNWKVQSVRKKPCDASQTSSKSECRSDLLLNVSNISSPFHLLFNALMRQYQAYPLKISQPSWMFLLTMLDECLSYSSSRNTQYLPNWSNNTQDMFIRNKLCQAKSPQRYFFCLPVSTGFGRIPLPRITPRTRFLRSSFEAVPDWYWFRFPPRSEIEMPREDSIPWTRSMFLFIAWIWKQIEMGIIVDYLFSNNFWLAQICLLLDTSLLFIDVWIQLSSQVNWYNVVIPTSNSVLSLRLNSLENKEKRRKILPAISDPG